MSTRSYTLEELEAEHAKACKAEVAAINYRKSLSEELNRQRAAFFFADEIARLSPEARSMIIEGTTATASAKGGQ